MVIKKRVKFFILYVEPNVKPLAVHCVLSKVVVKLHSERVAAYINVVYLSLIDRHFE